MENFKKLSKAEMKNVIGSALPAWPCTLCGCDDDGPLGPDTYYNNQIDINAIDLDTAQSIANTDCVNGTDGFCYFAVCQDPEDGWYNCNA